MSLLIICPSLGKLIHLISPLLITSFFFFLIPCSFYLLLFHFFFFFYCYYYLILYYLFSYSSLLHFILFYLFTTFIVFLIFYLRSNAISHVLFAGVKRGWSFSQENVQIKTKCTNKTTPYLGPRFQI
jgi:hypothetical protein